MYNINKYKLKLFFQERMKKMNISESDLRKIRYKNGILISLIFFLGLYIPCMSITTLRFNILTLNILVTTIFIIIYFLFLISMKKELKKVHPGLILSKPSVAMKFAKKNKLKKDLTDLNSINLEDVSDYELFFINNLSKNVIDYLDLILTLKLSIIPSIFTLFFIARNTDTLNSLIFLFSFLELIVLFISSTIAYILNHRYTKNHNPSSNVEYKIKELYECGAIFARDYMIYLKFFKDSNS